MLINEQEVNKMEIIIPNNNNIRRSVSCKTAQTSFTPTQLTERNSSSRPSNASLTVHSELLPDGYTLNDSWGLLLSEHASYKCTFSHSSLTVGRGLECDVVVNDPRVSNHHFTITLEREIVIERQSLPAKKSQMAVQKETNVKRTLENNAVCCKNITRTDKNKNFLPVTAHLGCNSFVEQSEEQKEENELEHVHLLHKIVMRVLLEDHSTNGTYVNDLRIGRGRRCELKNGDDIAIVLLPEKRSRRSDDSLTNSKMSNDDDKDEERLGEQNNLVGYNSNTNNNPCSNKISDKSQNKLPSNQGNAYERTKPQNKNNENQSQVEIANTRESEVKWISDIADERTYLERFCFHLYPKENAVEVKSNQSFAGVHVDSSTMSSANSGNVRINSTMSPLCIDYDESASHTSDKFISHNNDNSSSNIDSNKVKEDSIFTDKVNNASHVSPSHPLSMPSATRINGNDNDLIVQQQPQPQPPQPSQQRKRGQNWFNDVRDNFIAPQRASSRLRDASPAVLSSSSLVVSTLGHLTPLLTPANNNQAGLASNVVNYSIMPRRPLQWGPCIGSGASGKVHLGIDVNSSKLVAIKVLKGTRLSSKSQEHNSMSSLRTNSSNSYSSSSIIINNVSHCNSSNNNNNTTDDNDRNEQERKRVKTGESSCLSNDQQAIAMDEEEYLRGNNMNEDNSKENSISGSNNSYNSNSSISGKCSKSTSNSDSSSILSISDISVTNTHDSDDENVNSIDNDNNHNNDNVNVKEEEAKLIYSNNAKIFHAKSSESNTNTAQCKNLKEKEQVDYGYKRHDGCAHGLDGSSDVESNTDITNVLTPAHVRELWMLTRLQNHRVVRCLGFQYEEEKGLCIMMEYVAGGTLQSLIKSFGVFEENVIRMYTLQILEGLEYLEQNEVVHGDLKSSNVLVSERGNVKLTDFGTSHILRDVNMQSKWSQHHTSTHDDNNEDMDNVSVSMEGGSNNKRKKTKSQWKHVMCNGDVLCGTPLYMSPELIRTQISTHASDVWALGCVVFEMATGGILPWREVHHLGAHSIIYHIGSHVDSGPSLTDLYLTRAPHLEATHHKMESFISGKREPPVRRRSDTSVEEYENEEEEHEYESKEELEKYKYVPDAMYKRDVHEEEEEEERKEEQNQFLKEQYELYKRQLSQSKLREVKLMHEKMLPVRNKPMEIYSEELTPSVTLIDFIQSMLTIDGNTRPKASELLHHPFILGENTTEALLRWHEYCAMQRTEESARKKYDNHDFVDTTIISGNVVELQRATHSIETDENNNIISSNNSKKINSKEECNDNPLRASSNLANGTNNYNIRNKSCCVDKLTNDFGATQTQEKVEKLSNSEMHNNNSDTTSQWHDERHTNSTSNVIDNNVCELCNNDVSENNEGNVLVENEKEHINFEEEDNNVMTESQKSQPLITAPALALTRTNLQWHDNKIKNETWKPKNLSSPSLTSVAHSSPCICYKRETHSDSNVQDIECFDEKITNAHEYNNNNSKCTYLESKREMKQDTLLNDTTNNELHNLSHHRSSITPLSLAPSTNDDNESEKCQNDINNNCISRCNLVENNLENENESKAINLQSFGRLYTNYANNDNNNNSININSNNYSNSNRPVYTEEWPSVTVNKPFHSTLRSHQQYLRRHEQERRWVEMSKHYMNTSNNINNNWHDYYNYKQKFYKGQEHYNEQHAHHQNYQHRSSFATCDDDDDNDNKTKLHSNTTITNSNNNYYNNFNSSHPMTNYTNKRYKNNIPYYTPPTSTIAMNTINPCEKINSTPINLVTAGNNNNHRENKIHGNADFDAMTKNELTSYNQNCNCNKNVKQKNKVMDQEDNDNLLLCSANVLQTSTNSKSQQTTSPFTSTNIISCNSNDNNTSNHFSTHSPPSYNAHNKPFVKSTFQNLSWQQEHFLSYNNNNSNDSQKCKMKDSADQLHRAFSGNCTEKNNKLFSCMDKEVNNNNVRRWSNRELGAKSETSDKSYQTISPPTTTTTNNNNYNITTANEERNVAKLSKTKINVNDYKNDKFNKSNNRDHNKYISARKNVKYQTGHMDSTKVKRNTQQQHCKTINKSGLTSEFAHLFSSPEVFASNRPNRINVTSKRKNNKLMANTDNNKTTTVVTVTPLDIYEECNLEHCDTLDVETCTSRGDDDSGALSQLITNTKLTANSDSHDSDRNHHDDE